MDETGTTSPRPSPPFHGGEGDGLQLELIAGESDEALLVPRDQAAKRYTAATVEKIDLKRNYILDLLGFGMAVETVAQKTQTSSRVVNLLGAKYAQVVAANNLNFARLLKAKAAEFLFYATQKAPDAKFGELMVGVGIAAQRGLELEIAGSAVDTSEKTMVELEAENPALALARKFLEMRSAERGVRNGEAPLTTDPPSPGYGATSKNG